jgi:hypothetical protein
MYAEHDVRHAALPAKILYIFQVKMGITLFMGRDGANSSVPPL